MNGEYVKYKGVVDINHQDKEGNTPMHIAST
jgi:ankyrin repeat protein